MPYNKDGTKKQNPTKEDWYVYHLKKGTLKNKPKKTSASNQGGASVGS